MSTMFSPEDYGRLKAFVAIYMEFYADGPVPPEIHPLTVLSGLEKVSASRAKKGLLLAVQDLVESTTSWSAERVAKADQRLVSAGSFSLSELRRRYSQKYLNVLKRGSIRTEAEYYLLKGIADGTAIEPGATELDKILQMLAAYETVAGGRRR